VKTSVSYSPSANSRIFSARLVTLRLLFTVIYFNRKFHEQSHARLIIKLLWTSLVAKGGLGAVILQLKLPVPKLKYKIL